MNAANNGLAVAQAPLVWFQGMVSHCQEYALAARAAGHPVIGIMCEYAPRELIMAVGGVPVCLCGGDPDTIPAAEAHLPPNLCPLIKSTYGFMVEKTNPFLEMADLIVAETTCDGKKKMFELMAGQRETYLLELPQKEDDPDAMEHWVQELHKFKTFLESRYHTTITADRLRTAITTMNRERALRRGLANLMKSELPPLTGRQLLDLKSLISGIPADLAHYEQVLHHGQAGHHYASTDPSRVRVLLTGVPLVHGAERVMDLIEDHGGLVVCQENCTGLKPIWEEVPPEDPDPIRALAIKYYHLPCAVRSPNNQRLRLLRQWMVDYRAECVIDLIWHACHTYAIESYFVRRLVEEDLGAPYLRLETDYSPADSARLVVRIEAFMEMTLSRRPAQTRANSSPVIKPSSANR
jgi:benzoyl-CoA reductase/2-hydroxyglutaryl-CoA dehydratase subunit BcrC/BadD/HgdB